MLADDFAAHAQSRVEPSAESAAALAARLTRALAGVPGPVVAVDLDRFDANGADLLARAGGTPVRLASKSVRVRALADRALASGFRGIMAYSLAEALWLAETGHTDVLVAYPTVDREALGRLARNVEARRAIVVMVDDPAHLDLIAGALRAHPDDAPIRVCLDVDASLRLGLGPFRLHLGTRRSPIHTAADAARLAAECERRPGVRVVGIMTYEAQVAGLPDSGPAIRAMKRASVAQSRERRLDAVAAVCRTIDRELEFVNAGGTGSLEESRIGATEVTAGSGLYVPGLFDGYRAFEPVPSAFFGLDVVRLPGDGWATAFSGGYVASGPAARSRLPRLLTPGWRLTGREGVGEVQTPLRPVRSRGRRRAGSTGRGGAGPVGGKLMATGSAGRGAGRRPGAASWVPLRIGDRVWFRHAKAGELMERADRVHLVRGDVVVDVVPTYRGEGRDFG